MEMALPTNKTISFDEPVTTIDEDDVLPAGVYDRPEDQDTDVGGTMRVEANQAAELGFGAPEQSDLRLPRIRLAQGLTPEVMDGKAKGGDWLLPTGEVVQVLPAQLLGMKKSRQRRTGEQRDLVCSSADAQYGVGDPGIECAVCPFSQWTGSRNAPGGSKPPECTMFYDYLVQYVLDGVQGVAVLQLSEKSSQNVAGNFNTYLRAHGSGVQVNLGSEQVVKGTRRYFVPRIQGVRPPGTALPAGPTQAALPMETGK